MAKVSFAEKLRGLFGGGNSCGDEFFDDLADALIEGDVGAKSALEIVEALEKNCRDEKISSRSDVTLALKEMLLSCVREISLGVEKGRVNVFMALGVNGVGKTTSVAKMARLYSDAGENVLMAASDTFRAAAVDQLATHGERLNLRVVRHQMGSDPSAVVFDACDACRASGGGLVLADTAGRLHNKENLVGELKKIDRVAMSKADEGCCKKIIVLDATTGQNALRQAEAFNEAVGVDAIVLAKCDSTAKGGCLISIGRELGIPAAFVCAGEGYGDIRPFRAEEYVREFLGL